MRPHRFTPLLVIAALFLAPLAKAAPTAVSPPEITKLSLRPNGSFAIDSVRVFAGYFAPNWAYRADQSTQPVASDYPKRQAAAWETRVALKVLDNEQPITLAEVVERIDATTFMLRYEANHPSGVPIQEMFLQLEIPLAAGGGKSIQINRTSCLLPAEFAEAQLFVDHEVARRTLVIPGETGTVTIEGDFRIIVQDQRQWRQDTYAIRLRFEPVESVLLHASLDLKFSYKSAK